MKNVVVTGGTGFIGSHLIYKLKEYGYNIALFCRDKSDFKSIESIKDEVTIYKVNNNLNKMVEAFYDFKPEYVIHLVSYFKAEHTKDDIEKLIDTNIKFPSLILEAMNLCNIKKFINTGTAWQNYNNEDYNPVCLYASTKEAFEKIIEYYVKALDFKCITLKLFDSYGDNDNRGKLISALNNAAINNTRLNMTKGENKIDLTHVDDIVEGFIKALEYIDTFKISDHQKYAICTGRLLTLKEVVKIFENVIGYKLDINWGGREERKREVIEPWSNYEILPNWKSKLSLEDGLKKIYKNID